MNRLFYPIVAALALALAGVNAMATDLNHQNWKDPMHDIQSPRTDDAAIEAEIAERASVAPRVTSAQIEHEIAAEHYFTAADGANGAQWLRLMDEHSGHINGLDATVPPVALTLLTFCVLELKNGFTVTGESACASPENFDAAIGRKVARQNAVNKVWPLLGFRLRDLLHVHQGSAPAVEASAQIEAIAAAGASALPSLVTQQLMQDGTPVMGPDGTPVLVTREVGGGLRLLTVAEHAMPRRSAELRALGQA